MPLAILPLLVLPKGTIDGIVSKILTFKMPVKE
jgi:hypothetical protein